MYAIRLPANQVLQGEIEHLLTRPVGRPPRKPIVWFADFSYRAASWDRARRVIAKVEWHQGELFPRVGFIVTNMSAQAPGVVHFYNGRGTAEQWIKEGKYALNWTRLSCQRFVSNQVRLALFVLAYNLGNFLRRLVLPQKIKHWSLRTLLTKLIKIGAKVVRHSRIVTFQMAEVAVSQEVWAVKSLAASFTSIVTQDVRSVDRGDSRKPLLRIAYTQRGDPCSHHNQKGPR